MRPHQPLNARRFVPLALLMLTLATGVPARAGQDLPDINALMGGSVPTSSGPTPVSEIMGTASEKKANPAIIPAVAGPGEAQPSTTADKPAQHKLLGVWGKDVKEVSYTPLGAIAIFPVVRHGRDKAFGDLPLVFSNEFAARMEAKAKGTKVLNPVYTVEELRIRGLGSVYDQMVSYYLRAGAPDPRALKYLLKELSADGTHIERVVFVEADLDMNQPAKPGNMVERFQAWTADGAPKDMNHFIRSRVKVYDTSREETPLVWSYSWSKAVKSGTTFNVTPSVYQDSDSLSAFSGASRHMSWEMLAFIPKAVYQQEHVNVNASVQGEIVPQNAASNANENNRAGETAQPALSEADRAAIERILNRSK